MGNRPFVLVVVLLVLGLVLRCSDDDGNGDSSYGRLVIVHV